MKNLSIIVLAGLFVLLTFPSCKKDKMEEFESSSLLPNAEQSQQENEFAGMCFTKNIEFPGRASARAAGTNNRFWQPGQVLRVRFLGGSIRMQNTIKFYAKDWEKEANISFNFVTSGDAEIRIGFEDDGHWSQVGTDALFITDQNEATMNFDFSNWLLEIQYRRVILHEFGHALGMVHEHNHPQHGIQWNREAVYAYYLSTQGWDRAEVDAQLFNDISGSQSSFTSYDRESIMHYNIPASLTTNNKRVNAHTSLSIKDKRFIAMIYPRTSNWSNGWTVAENFEIGGTKYAFFLKSNTGRAHISRINRDGSIGTTTYNANWTTGWTTIRFFKKRGKTYVLMLKKNTGKVYIYRMNSNGTFGSRIVDQNWSTGYTNVEFYNKGNSTYALFHKASNGHGVIKRINNNGTIGINRETISTENGITSINFYKVAGKTFVMYQKESSRVVTTYRIKTNGKIGAYTSSKRTSRNWTKAKVYKTDNDKFRVFFLDSASGKMEIRSINNDGSLGDIVYQNNGYLYANQQMSITDFYEAGGKVYGLVLSENTGRLFIHDMK